MKIGVLASQGAFAEHIAMLSRLEVDTVPIRLPRELSGLDGLVIPGGESTSISKLMRNYKLTSKITNLAKEGLPIFGTCAGMILLANDVSDSPVETLGLMNIAVKRNAFGRQKDSFETLLPIPVLGKKPFPTIFIRAPRITEVKDGVKILARLTDDTSVAARQGNLLATSFHPELTGDTRFHQYFLDIVNKHQ
ncbi:pyridoxal 5'-phosphate synthase glutaminase subunit PdxT [Chloroflexota bacterium]